jgi:hypothetical protein
MYTYYQLHKEKLQAQRRLRYLMSRPDKKIRVPFAGTPAEYNRKYRKDHPEVIKAISKRHYEKHRKKIIARERKLMRKAIKTDRRKYLSYFKEYRKKNRDKYRHYNLQKTYGITLDQFQQMKTAQNNLCALCKQPMKDASDCCVDHNHSTQKVRELLCKKCNMGIGLFNESPALLELAINYLKKWT